MGSSRVLLRLCLRPCTGSEAVVAPHLVVEQNIVAVSHTELLGDANGGFVIGADQSGNAGQLEHVKAIAKDFAASFCGEALAPFFLGNEVVELDGLQMG